MSKRFAKRATHCTSYLVEAKGNEEEHQSCVKLISIYRSILQALDTIGTLTEKESDAHMVIANALLQQISIPLKNITETQAKDRRTVSKRADFDVSDVFLLV